MQQSSPATHEHRVTVVGPASWNTVVRLAELPGPGTRTVFAEDQWTTLGGTSASKALHLADLGVPTNLCTVLGNDAEAGLIRAALTHDRIELVAETIDGRSERHLNLMAGDGRASIYLSLPEPPGETVPQPVQAAVSNCAHVVLDLSRRAREAIPAARSAGATIWTDLHDYDGESDYHQPFVDAAQHVFLSDAALADPQPLMQRLVDGGTVLVVATRGPDGAIALDADGWHAVPAAAAEVVDTNGAGDAFLAGYLAATLRDAGVDQALVAGAAQATRAIGTRHLSPILDRPGHPEAT